MRHKLLFIFILSSISLFAFDYDAEYLELSTKYQLHADGSITETHHKKVKLHTYRATQRLFGEDFIIYNPEYQELTIHKSITIMKNGTKVKTPDNGYNEVLPRGVLGDKSYVNYREMVVTHTGLEKGAVIDFSYSITTKAGYLPTMMGSALFARHNPIKRCNLTVIVPKSRSLHYKTYNADFQPTKTEQSSQLIYQWQQKNISPYMDESNAQNLAFSRPSVHFSTANDWAQLRQYLKPKSSPNSKIQMSVKKLVADLADPFEKITAIQDYVVNNIGRARLHEKYTGYKIKNINNTFSENSGTALDKAFLLQEMLTLADLDAYVGIISTSSQFSKDLPSLSQFSDIVVFARWPKGETHIISPVKNHENSYEAQLSERYVLRLKDRLKPIKQLKTNSHHTNFQKMTLSLDLSDEKIISGKGYFNYGGCFNPYYTLKTNTTVPGFSALTTTGESIKQLELDESSISSTLISDTLTAENGYIYWEIPEFSHGFNNAHIVTALTDRRTNLNLTKAGSEEYSITLQLPENILLVTSDFNEYEKYADGSVRIKLSKDNDKVTITRKLILKSKTVTPENYPQFRKMIRLWQRNKYRQLIFKISE